MKTGVCNKNCFENFAGKTLFWPCTGPVQDCSVASARVKPLNLGSKGQRSPPRPWPGGLTSDKILLWLLALLVFCFVADLIFKSLNDFYFLNCVKRSKECYRTHSWTLTDFRILAFFLRKKSSSCDIDAWNSVNRILGQEKTSTSAGRQLQLMTSHPPSCSLYGQWPVKTKKRWRVLYCVVDTGYGLGRSLGDCKPALLKALKYQMVKSQTESHVRRPVV